MCGKVAAGTDFWTQPMPCLEALDIHSMSWFDQKTRDALLARAPRLRILRLHSLSAKLPQSVEEKLEYLEAAQSTAEHLHDHQHLCSLLHLNIKTLAIFVPWSEERALPQLRSLDLTLDTVIPTATAVFANLRMPQLDALSLKLHGRHPNKKDAALMLRALLSSSNPSLRIMQLENLCTSDAETINILGLLPELEYLALVHVKISDKVMEALSAPTRTGWLCPKLTHLHIASLHSKSTKFVVTQKGMQDLALARDEVVCTSATRGEESPIAKLVGVRDSISVLVREGAAMRWEYVDYNLGSPHWKVPESPAAKYIDDYF